ncbi:MAG: type VI secretion system baseplate subunit TssK [Gammaproteobacteria bacterium]|nr:type VI secretion system baseplate subunit TssK [Gammaproteobacteria bacterium]
MYQTAKVLWGEGLFLRPQHFQMQDQYHEQRLSEALKVLHPYAFGVRSITIDPVLLSNGLLSLSQANVIWPDGESYLAPERDVLPSPIQLDVNSLPDQLTVYLAIPILRVGQSNVSVQEQSGSARFVSKHTPVDDLMTNAETSEITVLQRLGRLILGGQLGGSQLNGDDSAMDGMISLPIAKLYRTTTGVFELDSAFVPPVISIGSSPTVMALLRRLMGVMQAKITTLYGHHREPGQDVIEFRSGDIASFWLLHTLSSSYATLSHFVQNNGFHPERLHQELLRMAGGLMTFAKSYTLDDLPAYIHDAPMNGFILLDQIIRSLLDTVISSRFLAIPLRETRASYWLGSLESDKIDRGTRLYLAVSSAMPAHELVASVPIRFKVGAPDDVEKRVLAALSAVAITHIAQVPSAIPIRPGSSYFALEPHGALYEQMLQAESICLYVPNGFADLKIELMAVMQS